jgi:uncharacterized protein (TIGR01777 family)
MTGYLIAGGSGFIGSHLSRKLKEKGEEVCLLTRKSNPSLAFKQIEWNPYRNEEFRAKEIEGYDVIVNLMGAGIDKRWSKAYKNEIQNSRIATTSNLVKAINNAGVKPKIFVSASAIGYYGTVEDGKVNEGSDSGKDFLADLSRKWEGAASEIDRDVKLIIPRFGVILGKDGGAFPQLKRAVESGISFNLMGRSSWKSWVHIEDAVSSIIFMIDNGFDGIYNVVSPNAVSMENLMNSIAKRIDRKIRVRLGPHAAALLLGEGSEYSIFGGQNVIPSKLLEMGFDFRYPNLDNALDDLLMATRQ